MPTLPPAPASSSALICLPLSYHQYGANSAGLLSFSVDVVGVSLTSVFLLHGSSLCQLHCGSTLWLWPASSLSPPALGPPVSFLAPPSFVTTLVSVCPLPPPRGSCYGAGRAFRKERVMSCLWTVLLCFCSLCVP